MASKPNIKIFMKTLPIIIIILLSGCTANPADCDPRTGGFIDGMTGLMSGCYEQRVTMKQQEYSSTQSLTEQLQEENRRLEQQKRYTDAQLREVEGKLAKLERENTQLERNLQKMQVKTTAQQNEKKRLQSQLQQVKQQISTLQRQAQVGSIPEEQLRQDIERLTRERDDLATAIAEASIVQ